VPVAPPRRIRLRLGVARALLHDRRAVVADTREHVSRGGAADGVDGDADIAVHGVLQAHRHRQPGRELPVRLAATVRAPIAP